MCRPMLYLGLAAIGLITAQASGSRVAPREEPQRDTPALRQTQRPRPVNWGVPAVRRPIEQVVIHHTVGHERSVAQIRAGHLRRGFRDVAYHYVVHRDGWIEPGRNIQVEGAGVWGRHHGLVEIVLVGKLHRERASEKQWRAATDWAARWCLRYRLPYHRVHGHREWAARGHETLCPGLDTRAFRRAVQRRMEELR